MEFFLLIFDDGGYGQTTGEFGHGIINLNNCIKDGKVEFFWELNVWKKADVVVAEIYEITKYFPVDERFGLISQIKRAAISITGNIAEGFARYYFKDKLRFYYHSRGSLAEVQNYLIVARKQKYVAPEKAQSLLDELAQIQILLNALISSVAAKV